MKHYLFRGLSLCGLFLLCQCGDQGAAIKIKGLRDEIDQLNQQNYEAAQQVRRLKAQVDATREEKDKVDSEKSQLDSERTAADKRVQELKAEFDSYKQKYKLSIRTRAPGMKINDFKASDGRAFVGVTLKSVEDHQISFAHRDGFLKLDAKLLPEEVQGILGYLVPNVETNTQTASMSNRMLNKMHHAERDANIDAQNHKIQDLRKQLEKASKSQADAQFQITNAKGTGESTAEVQRVKRQLDTAIAQIKAQLLQAEVDLHALTMSEVKLLPEK